MRKREHKSRGMGEQMEEQMEGQKTEKPQTTQTSTTQTSTTQATQTSQRSQTIQSQQKRRGSSSRNKVSMLLLPLAVLLTAGLTTAVFYIKDSRKPPEPEGLVYEANIVQGDIPGKTKEERQRELDNIVEEGMLAMSINATPSGKTTGADRSINWLIENPSNQGKLIRIEVWNDASNEKIYETGAIPPGNYVESAPLNMELPPGEYPCTARFYAYQEETETYIGQAAAQITLTLYE